MFIHDRFLTGAVSTYQGDVLMVNLIMHCGGHHVSREAVQKAPTPERTNTWVPIPHNRLLEIAEATIEQQGYTVTNEAHGLWGEVTLKNGFNRFQRDVAM